MTNPARSLPLVALVIVAAVLVIEVPLVAGGKTWNDVTYQTDVVAPRVAASDAVLGGALPAWWEGTGLGVPLAAEPSHGAMYPLYWVAWSPRVVDLVTILHLVFAAIGIALWARQRKASEPAIVVVALLAVTSGLFASMAMRGALPAIAMLPWIGAAASWLGDDRKTNIHATVVLALAIGFCGLAGVFGALVDGLLIAVVVGARRKAWLAIAIVAGLAISAAQWLPALLFLGDGAGDVVHGIPPSRFLELVLPTSTSDRPIVAMAGENPWAPSLFVGAALLALAAVRIPSRKEIGIVIPLVVIALVVGRGGWPAWLGAPEVHLAALVVVLATHAASGLDDLLAGKRRAWLALVAAAMVTAIALASLVALRSESIAPAVDRALLYGGVSLACLVIACVLVWRDIAPRAVLVLLLLSTVSTVPATAPTIARPHEPAFATAAHAHRSRAPLRVFRPVYTTNAPGESLTLEEALATFAGPAWGVGAARSEDPARLPIHDRTWQAASREGGALLDRFGLELAILPESLVASSKFEPLSTRGAWTLAKLPVAPPASVLRGALWSTDPANTLDLMYPLGGGTGVLRGTVVLHGKNQPSLPDQGPPLPCTIDRWTPGAIDLTCSTIIAAYAVVSSSTARGWSVTVDGNTREWHTADLLRRAVRIEPGTHRIAWRYVAPGSQLGLALAIGALLGLVALVLASRVRRRR